MNKFKVFIATSLITIYELTLIVFTSDTFTMKRNWLTIIDNMPVYQSNIEFVIAIGQLPIVFFLAWVYYKKQKAEEADFLNKYGKDRQEK